MSKQLPVNTQTLEHKARQMWNTFDEVKTRQALNPPLQKEAREKFWENYQDLLKKAQRNAELLKSPAHKYQPQKRRPSPALQLTGLFMMAENKLTPFKKALFLHKQMPSIATTLLLVLALIIINVGLHWQLITLVVLVAALTATIRYYSNNTPLENTIIEIQTDKIVRRGSRLTTSLIKLDKLTHMQENKLGLVLKQNGFWNQLYYLFSENNIIKNARVVYIPNAIESYDEIKVFLEEKVAKNKAII
ncbi:hypothetical protein BKI52_42850 [marine bacterium AO1-C]|nr:hypothetical protein BKI52_42850 [marine bacterium AO1-C]